LSVGLIGILTSQRVLLLSADLKILSSCNYLSDFETPLIGEGYRTKAVSDIQFVGSALMYITLSGNISYLVPSSSSSSSKAKAKESDELMITEYFQDLCLRENENCATETNLLFKIPLKLSANGSAQLCCVFSDRILLMYRDTTRLSDPQVQWAV